MAWKNLKQRSLAEDMIIDHEALKELDGVDEQIDWSRIEKLLMHIHSSNKGEKAWPPLMMFKALLLQSWYDTNHTKYSSIIEYRESKSEDGCQ